jgi:beta-hydroxylase
MAHMNPWTVVNKVFKKAAVPCIAIAVAPMPFLLLIATGILDLRRNKGIGLTMTKQYFLGNGMLTWLLSPLNLILDFACLPHRNPGIYAYNQLPEECKEEISYLIEHAAREQLSERVCELLRLERRGMLMFKWYGKSYETSIPMKAYEKQFQYVRTIGVSVFNRRQSTSLHFGPLRATLRVLYNISECRSRDVYIDVGPTRHFWADEKLLIFDDTLQHRSVNESDDPRVCLFIDVLRPSLAPAFMSFVVWCVRVTSCPVRKFFYSNWTFLK